MAAEQTLVLLKPDALQRKLAGEILRRFEGRGLGIRAARLLTVDGDLADQHYAEHREKRFFGELVEFITSAPTLALVLEGEGAIAVVRTTMGATDPANAAPGTIRGDLALSMPDNLVHGSDSPESAEREIALWFGDELQILGDVAGKDVLEYGCGAAQWSILLARAGARPVGLDNSGRQLEHARRLMAEAGVDFPLVHASAGDAPLEDSSFDVVFCDHGAMTFADPYATVPEVARLLRPGGLFAFSHMTPLAIVCVDEEADTWVPELKRPLFGLHRIDWGGEEPVDFNLAQGEWIRLFRDNGFLVEDLIEVQPPDGATSTYRSEAETEWARRWPMEQIWRLRKQ